MFTYQGHISGAYSPKCRTFKKASGTYLKDGMLCTKSALTSLVVQFAVDTAQPVLGIVQGTKASTDSTVDVIVLATGSLVMADVQEIDKASVFYFLSADSTIVGNYVVSSLSADVGCLKNAVIQIYSCANSTTTFNSVYITVSGNSCANILIASANSTFADGDSFRLITLDGAYVHGAQNWSIETTSSLSVTLIGTGAGAGDFLRGIGTNDKGTKILAVVTAGFDLVDAIA